MENLMEYIISGVLAAIGIACVSSGLYRVKGIYKRCTAKTSATVISNRGSRGARRRVVYEATLEDGKTVIFEERSSTEGLYAPEVGETVELFYDPNDHKRFSYPKRSRSFAIFYFICGAITFAVAAYVLIKFTVI